MTTSGAGLSRFPDGATGRYWFSDEQLAELQAQTVALPHALAELIERRSEVVALRAAHASLVAAVNELLAAEDFMLHMPLNSLVDGPNWGHEARWNAALDAVRTAATDRSAGDAE